MLIKCRKNLTSLLSHLLWSLSIQEDSASRKKRLSEINMRAKANSGVIAFLPILSVNRNAQTANAN